MTHITTSDVVNVEDDPDSIDVAVTALRSAATAARDAGASAERHWQGLALFYAGPGQDQLFEAMLRVRDEAEAFAASYEQLAQALHTYSEDLRPIIQMRQRLYRDAAEFSDVIRDTLRRDATVGQRWDDNPAFTERDHWLRYENHGVRLLLAEAQQRCVRALDNVDGGTGAALPPVQQYQFAFATPTVGALGLSAQAGIDYTATLDQAMKATAIATLNRLADKTSDQVAAWATSHSDTIHALIDNPPTFDRVERWWTDLGRDSQAALLGGAPLLIGNLNGIPWNTRIDANRATLRIEIQRLDEAITAAPAEDDKHAATLRKERDVYARMLTETPGYLSAESTAQSDDRRNIVVFDPDREAVAEYIGYLGPDGTIPSSTADVGIYVPGTNSTLAGVNGNRDVADRLYDMARPGAVGMVLWQGGHFPQTLEAIYATSSEQLGPRLASFTATVPIPTTTTVTAVGYSYGGAVVGRAELAGMDVDRVLHVSSAGLGYDVRGLDQYPNTADAPHYAMMAPGDVIVGASQGLQWNGDQPGLSLGHGGSPLDTPGVTRLDTGYLDAEQGRASGPVTSHFVWQRAGSSIYRQTFDVITGGTAVLAPTDIEDEWNPLSHDEYANMQPGYRPQLIQVEGEQ